MNFTTNFCTYLENKEKDLYGSNGNYIMSIFLMTKFF